MISVGDHIVFNTGKMVNIDSLKTIYSGVVVTTKDSLVIKKYADLTGGTLNIILLNGCIPEEGEIFEVMNFTSRTDTFDVVNGTEIMNCRYFEVQYTDTTVLLAVYGLDPPQLTRDTLSIRQDEPVEINVLANDTTGEGDTLMVVALGTPLHGTAVMTGDSILTYTPETGFAGQDSVTYVVQRRAGCINSSRVVLDVYSTVGIEPLPDASHVFSVESPRPNPFDLATTFRFYLPEDAFVELSVTIFSENVSLLRSPKDFRQAHIRMSSGPRR